MIVVACYNDINIKNLIEDFRKTIDFDESVLVVITNPDDIDFYNDMKNSIIENKYPFKIDITMTPYRGYDSGAYIWSYYNFPDDYYIFLQDSLIIKDYNWLNVFKSHREEKKIISWLKFKMGWDSDLQERWILSHFNENTIIHPEYGIFGPIFQISKFDLDIINDKYNLNNFIPHNKSLQCGMERGWSYLCSNSDIKLESIEGMLVDNDFSNNFFDRILFKKIFLRRN